MNVYVMSLNAYDDDGSLRESFTQGVFSSLELAKEHKDYVFPFVGLSIRSQKDPDNWELIGETSVLTEYQSRTFKNYTLVIEECELIDKLSVRRS